MSDFENYVIHNGTYQRLEKAELMELPWIHECLASADAGAMLFINNCRGFKVSNINDGGAIMGPDPQAAPIYIGRYSADKKPNRFYILRMCRDDDGFVEQEPWEIIPIRKVTVSADYTDSAGPRVFSDGPDFWRYY